MSMHARIHPDLPAPDFHAAIAYSRWLCHPGLRNSLTKAPLASAAKLRGLDALALCISIGAVGNTMTTVVGGILGAPRVCYVWVSPYRYWANKEAACS